MLLLEDRGGRAGARVCLGALEAACRRPEGDGLGAAGAPGAGADGGLAARALAGLQLCHAQHGLRHRHRVCQQAGAQRAGLPLCAPRRAWRPRPALACTLVCERLRWPARCSAMLDLQQLACRLARRCTRSHLCTARSRWSGCGCSRRLGCLRSSAWRRGRRGPAFISAPDPPLSALCRI